MHDSVELASARPVSEPEAKRMEARKGRGAAWLFTRLAFQNLLRRPTRTLMLLLAVGLSTGAVFASFVVARGIEASMAQSFARMGADLVVVPAEAMVNITSALLTVQPTDESLDEQVLDAVAKVDGVDQAAPQTIYRVPIMSGMPEHEVNLIAFDPGRDFTVVPWLTDKLPRAMKKGDLLVGSRRAESVSEEVEPCGKPALIYGKLGRTGVGPFDESFFATYETVSALGAYNGGAGVPALHRNKISAVLVRLKCGATAEQVRFAIARLPGVKVVSGAIIVTSTRQATNVLLSGMAGLTAFLLAGSFILVGLLFSAIIAERRREIGLLRAIGTRRTDILRMLVAEGVFAMAAGGLCGLVFGGCLLMVFQHSLVYYLSTLHVDFAWPRPGEIGSAAGACLLLAALAGLAGALVPAWRSCDEDPYVLIRAEGA